MEKARERLELATLALGVIFIVSCLLDIMLYETYSGSDSAAFNGIASVKDLWVMVEVFGFAFAAYAIHDVARNWMATAAAVVAVLLLALQPAIFVVALLMGIPASAGLGFSGISFILFAVALYAVSKQAGRESLKLGSMALAAITIAGMAVSLSLAKGNVMSVLLLLIVVELAIALSFFFMRFG